MRKYLAPERGVTLLELMIYMTVTVILLSGMLSLFSTSLRIWTVEKSRTSMQQTARIAVDRFMRELRYAQDICLNSSQSVTITKQDGETNTFHLGEGGNGNTLYMTINKTNVVPYGGSSKNPITENVVTNLVFTPYPDINNVQVISVTIEVTDKNTGEKQAIHTAGYPWNRR